MKKFNVGVQLFGLRNALANDFEGTLQALYDMGYEYVEFAGYYGKSSDEIKEILDRIGLKSISVHQKLDFFNADPEGSAEYLKNFGIKYVIVPSHPVQMMPGTDGWGETCQLFGKWAEFLSERGMMLGYHNHDFEYGIYDGKYFMDSIIGCVPEGKITPELDTCWVRYAGLKPEEEIRKYKGRIPIVHLKDFVCTKKTSGPVYELIGTNGTVDSRKDKAADGFEFRPLGEGVQDFEAILKACEESGTETVIVEQDNVYGGMTELEAAKISRDYLKNTFNI